MIVEIPAVTKPVRYSTCPPTQNQNSGWGPKRVRQSSISTASSSPANQASARCRRGVGSTSASR